jgi:poly(beta-D-mannuronate) lyase
MTGGQCLGLIGAAAWALALPAHAACEPPPPAVSDIAATRGYGDAAGTVIDPEAEGQNRLETKPLTEFLRAITDDADRAWKRPGRPEAATAGRCAAVWLAAWANGKAWLGVMGSKQAEYQRKWDLAGAAIAYLKVKPFATPEQRAVIEPWLIAWADSARAFFDAPGVKRNNHWYWLGLGLGATGLATDSARHWDAGRAIAQDAARDIAGDGSLSLELARTSRALHYHAFSVMPLVTLATLARTKGEDFYAFGDHALDRLVDLTARGLADAAVFATLAGVPQSGDSRPGAGWSQLYALHRPDSPAAKLGMQRGHRWLGGDVQLLVRALAQK